jgi:hypothetical protein
MANKLFISDGKFYVVAASQKIVKLPHDNTLEVVIIDAALEFVEKEGIKSQSLAVVMANRIDGDVFSFTVTEESIFGDIVHNEQKLKTYLDKCYAHSLPFFGLVTRLNIVGEDISPYIAFSAVRALDELEYQAVLKQRKTQECVDAVGTSISSIPIGIEHLKDGVTEVDRASSFLNESIFNFVKANKQLILISNKNKRHTVLEQTVVNDVPVARYAKDTGVFYIAIAQFDAWCRANDIDPSDVIEAAKKEVDGVIRLVKLDMTSANGVKCLQIDFDKLSLDESALLI